MTLISLVRDLLSTGRLSLQITIALYSTLKRVTSEVRSHVEGGHSHRLHTGGDKGLGPRHKTERFTQHWFKRAIDSTRLQEAFFGRHSQSARRRRTTEARRLLGPAPREAPPRGIRVFDVRRR